MERHLTLMFVGIHPTGGLHQDHMKATSVVATPHNSDTFIYPLGEYK